MRHKSVCKCDQRHDSHGSRTVQNRRGAAYVLAVTTLLVGITFALAMLRSIDATFLAESSLHKRQSAANLAEAGMDYALWQMLRKGQDLPYTADVTLSTGSFHVNAVDDSARQPKSMLITSTGTYKGYGYTWTRVKMFLPYDYAWCQNSSLVSAQPIISTALPRGMHVNGSITLTSSSTRITTGAWATGLINTAGQVTPQYPGTSAMPFPQIDYALYNSIADIVYTKNTKFTDLTPGTSSVIVVNGKATFDGGSYDGVITVVATGIIDVRGSVVKANSGSFLALISAQQVIIEGSATSVDAVVYSHSPSNSGEIYSKGSGRTVTGCVAADNIRVDGTFTVNRDSRLTRDIMSQLRLPGMQ